MNRTRSPPHRISVIESGSASQAGCWVVDVRCNDEPINQGLSISDPFSAEDEIDFRWYLESFTTASPFETEKAYSVRQRLQQYGPHLFAALQLQGLVDQWTQETSEDFEIEIEILEHQALTKEASDTIHRLHWETLEATELWAPSVKQVVVKRRLANEMGRRGVKTVRSWPLQVEPEAQKTSFNMLLVVARNLMIDGVKHQDRDPMLTLRTLLDIKRQLEASRAPYVLDVEVVRPGTFEALEEHLDNCRAKHGPGYFQLVHFDMHGYVRREKGIPSAFLLFASRWSLTQMPPISATRIAKLLEKHGIGLVVLNACESARSNKGVHANLAKVLVSEGVSNVLAMSFKVMLSTARLFLGALYQSFFLRGATFSQAVSSGRLYLKDHPQRLARFGLQVDVEDWLVPVTYTNGEDVRVIASKGQVSQQTHVELQTSASAIPSKAPTEDPLLGRDFDKLRFERHLIHNQVVYMCGPGGCGKSAMLLDLDLEWLQTGFTDHVIHLDCTTPVLELDAIIQAIASECSENQLDALPATKQHVLSQMRNAKTILVLDSLDLPYSECVQEAHKEDDLDGFTKRTTELYSFLLDLVRESRSSNYTHKFYLILVGRQLDPWLRQHFPDLGASSFSLGGLDLPSSVTLSERIFEKHKIGSAKRNVVEDESLVHIVDLLQRLPRTMQLILPHLKSHSSLQELYESLITGRVVLSLDISKLTPVMSVQDRHIVCLRRLLEDSNTLRIEALLCCAPFWTEGPMNSVNYFAKARELSSCPGDDRNLHTAAFVVQDFGGWTMTGGDITWIHPIWTLLLRGRRHQIGWRTPEEHLAVREIYLTEVEQRFMVAFVQQNLLGAGSDTAVYGESQRISLGNFLCCAKMCCNAAVPTKIWPTMFFSSYTAPSRLFFSIPQQLLIATAMENLLNVFLQRNEGKAVELKLLHFPVSLATYLSAVYRSELEYISRPAHQFVDIALRCFADSEAQFGSLGRPLLAYKGLALRHKAMEFIIKDNMAAANDCWAQSTVIDREIHGSDLSSEALTSRYKTSDTDGAGRGGQSVEMQCSQNEAELLLSKATADNQARLASFVNLRHSSWDWITAQIGHEKSKPNELMSNAGQMQEFAMNISKVLKVHSDTNVTGLERWKQWFPQGRDVEACLGQVEDKTMDMKELEIAIERADWATAMKFHRKLHEKAARERNWRQTVYHGQQFTKLFAAVGNEDVMSAGQKQAALKMYEEISKMLEVHKDTGITDARVSVAQFDESVLPSLLEVAGVERGEKIKDLIAFYKRGLAVSASEMRKKMEQGREVLGPIFVEEWERDLENVIVSSLVPEEADRDRCSLPTMRAILDGKHADEIFDILRTFDKSKSGDIDPLALGVHIHKSRELLGEPFADYWLQKARGWRMAAKEKEMEDTLVKIFDDATNRVIRERSGG